MEDGDLWQAYIDADPIEGEVTTTTNDEIAAAIMDNENAITGPSSDDVTSSSSSATTTSANNNNVDVGPPVNIYAEAHRHAQIKADVTANETNNNDSAETEEESDNSTREGPHASLHLSSELKQNQKKLSSDDNNNAQVSDSVDESKNDGDAAITETATSDQKAAADTSVDDDVPQENDAEKESTNKSIDDSESMPAKTESNSESNTDANVDTAAANEKEGEEEITTTTQPNRTRTVSEDEEEDDEGPAKIILVDYASKLAGAQVLEKSPSFKGASNLLTGDSDKYAIAPCEDKKYVVIGLSEDILVKQIKLSNFERYSSHVREFQVLASQEYPAPSAEYWTLIGTFEANTRNGEQTFDLEEPAWARYLKFKFKSHFGAEHYCTLSQIKVHGSTMLQGFHEQWIESEKELEQEKENQQQQQQQQQEGNAQGEIDAESESHEQQDGNVVVQDKMVDESRSLDNERDVADSKDSVDDAPEPIADSDSNDSDKTEENHAVDASPEKEMLEGESVPTSEDVIEPDLSPPDNAGEEPSGKTDQSGASSDVDAPISRKEAESDQQDDTEVPTETRIDDEKLEEGEQDPANNIVKPEHPSKTNMADEVEKTDSDEKAASDDSEAVPLVKEMSVDATANASDISKTDEEAIPSSTNASANDKNGVNDTESSNAISEGQDQVENTSSETSDTTNKTNDITDPSSNPASTEKKNDDTKTVSSDSVVFNVQEPSKSDTNSNIKEPPPKATTEKDATPNNSSPVAEKIDVKVAVNTSADLVARLSKRFPNASCIKDLDFHAFKKRTILSNASQKGQVPGQKGLGQVPGPKMEPIFAKITNEIKSVQMTQHQYEQYISAVKTCYEKLFLDMANDLDSIQRDYDDRLSNLEDILSNIVPGALSKQRDYKLMAISTLAALSNADHTQLALMVGFAMLMMFLRFRRKKTNLKMPSNSTPKSSTCPAEKGATPPVTPSSSGEVSPSSVNEFVGKRNEEEPSLQHEILVNGRATANQPALVRIISSEEKENTRAAANCQG